MITYKLEGIYEGKTSLKVDLAAMPSHQGNGLLQCSVKVKNETDPAQTMYVNTASYDAVKITPVDDDTD